MNVLDLLILVALAGGLLLGLRSGLIKQVMSLIGFLLAFVLALNLMEPAGSLVVDSLGISPRFGRIIGFILVFAAVQVMVYAAVYVFEAIVGALRLSLLNRFLGGALGLLKAALALSITFLVLGLLGFPSEETRADSALYAPTTALLPAAWDAVAEHVPHVKGLRDRFEGGSSEQVGITDGRR